MDSWVFMTQVKSRKMLELSVLTSMSHESSKFSFLEQLSGIRNCVKVSANHKRFSRKDKKFPCFSSSSCGFDFSTMFTRKYET